MTKTIILACVTLFLLTEIALGAVSKKTDPNLLAKANRITMPFVQNKGQLENADILYYANTFAGMVIVNKDGSIGYRLAENQRDKEHQTPFICERLGTASETTPTGERKAVAKANYFKGKDPKKWVTDISTFNSVNMGEIYPGVSLRLQAHGNNVEKIFSVHPGADPRRIRLNIDGAKALRLTPKGELEVNTGAGSLRFAKPVAYQPIDGKKTPIDVAYAVKGRSYGFKLAAYDTTKELIIDPLITGIFQGAEETRTRPTCMAADSQGNIYVGGYSADQLAVFKFNGRLETLLGSALFGSNDRSSSVYDIAVARQDDQDVIYLVGSTPDENFPVTEGAFDTSFNKGWISLQSVDVFVMKCHTDLNNIFSSTYVGGLAVDRAYGIAIAPDDTVYVAGESQAPAYATGPYAIPFPTSSDAYDTDYGDILNTKAFVIRLDSELQEMLASTLLGGNKLMDAAFDIAIDAEGDIVVTGVTGSEQFPISDNCADASFQGYSEAFVSKFAPDLKNLMASTFLGGADKDKANVLGLTASNEIVVAGWTSSSDFPVVQGNFDTSYSDAYEDGFVTRLSSDLTTINASTFLGGNGHEQVSDMVIGEDGRVLLCGGTTSPDFPMTEDYHDNSYNGPVTWDFYLGDGFLSILDQSLTALSASTYLGGNWHDHATSILVSNDDIIVAGETSSDNFPYISVKKGHSDAFICRFNPNEAPAPRQFTGRPGHWQSKDMGTPEDSYLNINICTDGSFNGVLRLYNCVVFCTIEDYSPSFPVSGTIDFQNWSGTMTLDDDHKDISFEITRQIPDEFIIHIPDESTNNWPAGQRIFLYYEGEWEDGTCEAPPPPPPPENDGGGGGGCFLKSTAKSF